MLAIRTKLIALIFLLFSVLSRASIVIPAHYIATISNDIEWWTPGPAEKEISTPRSGSKKSRRNIGKLNDFYFRFTGNLHAFNKLNVYQILEVVQTQFTIQPKLFGIPLPVEIPIRHQKDIFSRFKLSVRRLKLRIPGDGSKHLPTNNREADVDEDLDNVVYRIIFTEPLFLWSSYRIKLLMNFDKLMGTNYPKVRSMTPWFHRLRMPWRSRSAPESSSSSEQSELSSDSLNLSEFEIHHDEEPNSDDEEEFHDAMEDFPSDEYEETQ